MTEHHWQDQPAVCPECGRPWRPSPIPPPRRGPGSTDEGRAAARALYERMRADRSRQESGR